MTEPHESIHGTCWSIAIYNSWQWNKSFIPHLHEQGVNHIVDDRIIIAHALWIYYIYKWQSAFVMFNGFCATVAPILIIDFLTRQIISLVVVCYLFVNKLVIHPNIEWTPKCDQLLGIYCIEFELSDGLFEQREEGGEHSKIIAGLNIKIASHLWWWMSRDNGRLF